MYNQTLPHGDEAMAETWECHTNVAWTQVSWLSKNGTQPSFPVCTKGNAIIGSNCPRNSGTVPDYKNLSQVPERYVKCPGSRQENCKGSVAIIVSNKYAML